MGKTCSIRVSSDFPTGPQSLGERLKYYVMDVVFLTVFIPLPQGSIPGPRSVVLLFDVVNDMK